jgi:hypothetical protein
MLIGDVASLGGQKNLNSQVCISTNMYILQHFHNKLIIKLDEQL